MQQNIDELRLTLYIKKPKYQIVTNLLDSNHLNLEQKK